MSWLDSMFAAVTGVMAVTGVAPVASTGGQTPAISLSTAGAALGDIMYYNGTAWVPLPLGPAVHRLTSTGQGPTYNVTETAGQVLLTHSVLTSHFTDMAPPTPTLGMSISLKAGDSTFSDTNYIAFNGNGNPVEYQGAQQALNIFKMTPDNAGYGAQVTFTWDGAQWSSG